MDVEVLESLSIADDEDDEEMQRPLVKNPSNNKNNNNNIVNSGNHHSSALNSVVLPLPVASTSSSSALSARILCIRLFTSVIMGTHFVPTASLEFSTSALLADKSLETLGA